MTTPSGQISLGNVNTELGYSATAQISMNDAAVRTLAGVPSGAISMQNLQGKSNRVAINLVISADTLNYNIFSNKGGTYIAGKSDVTVTVNSNIKVGSSTSTGYSMDTGTGWTTGDTITIINNGYIVGKGGNGAASKNDGTATTNAENGSSALRLQYATSINNLGVIGGGGGGGAGDSGNSYWGVFAGNSGGGAGYPVGLAGTGGTGAGNNGTTTNGGNGSTTPSSTTPPSVVAAGGTAGNNGADSNAASDIATYYTYTTGGAGGGLGGWGGFYNINSGSTSLGGAPGACVVGNNYATWIATGTRYGVLVAGQTQTASYTFTTSTNMYNNRGLVWALLRSNNTGYVPGITTTTITINAGVAVYNATGNTYPALRFNFYTGSDTYSLVNNGTVAGYGGTGANSGGTNNQAGYSGGAAGTAIVVSGGTLSVTNNGVIGGGGGGGGSGGHGSTTNGAGGAGGGGQSYNASAGGTAAAGGGNGGAGSSTVGGNGGTGYGSKAGGTGTSNGVVGNTGTNSTTASQSGGGGGGGGFGATGGVGGKGGANAYAGGAGGAAGACLTGNSLVTWVATGTRYGTIS